MSEIIRNSLFISLLSRTPGLFYSIERWVDWVYCDSRTYKITGRFWSGTRVVFKYSFLGRVAEISEKISAPALDNSNLAKCPLNLYNMMKLKIADYARTSTSVAALLSAKRDIYVSPVKIGSVIVVIAILINTIFSVLLNKEIVLAGWVIRLIFLFIGLSGLFCNADWEEVKETSFVLKKGLI